MRRTVFGALVLAVLAVVSPAGAAEKVLPEAKDWLLNATTVGGFNVGLTQVPNAQIMPSSHTECTPFNNALTRAMTVTSSTAVARWAGRLAEVDDEVFVFRSKKEASRYIKPELDSAAATRCITAAFTAPAGSSTTSTVNVHRKTVKIHGTQTISYVVNVTLSAPNRPSVSIEAQSLVVRYKSGVVDSFMYCPKEQFPSAAGAYLQAIKQDIKSVD